MKSKNVILFSTPTCSWCRKLKTYFKENKIRFKEIDVSSDPIAMRDMIKKSGQRGVPQTWVNNYPVIGFDKDKLKKLLEI
ncbi:MAG: NrdH-redoxin [Candidatus Cloacimonetes bacterium]|nr:NrdH-redoxin [Candidatus Cloacimonadota bacterium]